MLQFNDNKMMNEISKTKEVGEVGFLYEVDYA